jgi:hypothetical protein
MPHYFLEGFENEWTLVRETPSSQKFTAKTPDGKELNVDVHYTMPKVLTVNIVFLGDKNALSKSWLTPVMDEIARIAMKRSDYAVIDYTLACATHVSDGNYSIDEKMRKVMNKMTTP